MRLGDESARLEQVGIPLIVELLDTVAELKHRRKH
jgi:hypothetical protein